MKLSESAILVFLASFIIMLITVIGFFAVSGYIAYFEIHHDFNHKG